MAIGKQVANTKVCGRAAMALMQLVMDSSIRPIIIIISSSSSYHRSFFFFFSVCLRLSFSAGFLLGLGRRGLGGQQVRGGRQRQGAGMHATARHGHGHRQHPVYPTPPPRAVGAARRCHARRAAWAGGAGAVLVDLMRRGGGGCFMGCKATDLTEKKEQIRKKERKDDGNLRNPVFALGMGNG